MHARLFVLAALWCACVPWVHAAGPPPAAGRPVDFVADIQPILTAHCLECHGPERQKGDLRLDVRSSAFKGGSSGHAALVPGDALASPLFRLVAELTEGERMPPKGPLLDAAALGLLRAWIDQGASWPESASARVADPGSWWSLQPLRRPPVPAGSAHPVDAFIRARCAAASLTPAPEADRRSLIRRVTLDLTGLPPSPEEVAAFVADKDPRAYEILVDRLLASPRSGERWARTWLDIVHYGDTDGYD